MWLMLQQETPEDFVIATGTTTSIRDMLTVAFEHLDLNYEDYVEIDPKFFRPTEVEVLLGDPSQSFKKLDWKPKTTMEEMICEMVDADMVRVEKEIRIRD